MCDLQAARYQMIIMFIIASTTSCASMAVISMAAFEIVDKKTRLDLDCLTDKNASSRLAQITRRWSKVTAVDTRSVSPELNVKSLTWCLQDI